MSDKTNNSSGVLPNEFGPGLQFGISGIGVPKHDIATIIGVRSGIDNDSGALLFWTINSGVWSEKMRITPAGNVGIGSTNPGSKVTVSGGDIYVSSSAQGVILKAPDGHCARVTLSNANALVITTLTCPSN